MANVEKMDWEWYWLGVSIGANMRKTRVQTDKIEDYGVQGIKTTPTNEQTTSLYLGIRQGRRMIVNNLDTVLIYQTQDKRPHRVAKPRLQHGAKAPAEVVNRGDTVNIPVYVANNAADNRGVIASQTLLEYNPEHLDILEVTPSVHYTGTVETQVDQSTGRILIKGTKEQIDYKDGAIANITAKVKDTVPQDVAEIPLQHLGTQGTGTGSELLTRIGDLNFYITPHDIIAAIIKLIWTVLTGGRFPPISFPSLIPPAGLGTGGTEVSFDFVANVSTPPGVIPNGGISADLIVVVDGVEVGRTNYPLEVGENKVSAKVPANIGSFRPGSVVETKVEIVVEDEADEGLYYVYIPAGALITIETIKTDKDKLKDKEKAWLLQVKAREWGKWVDKVTTRRVEVFDGNKAVQEGGSFVDVVVYSINSTVPPGKVEDSGGGFSDTVKTKIIEGAT